MGMCWQEAPQFLACAVLNDILFHPGPFQMTLLLKDYMLLYYYFHSGNLLFVVSYEEAP